MELIKDKFIYSQMPIYSFDIAKYILSIFVITIHSFGFIENNIENELAVSSFQIIYGCLYPFWN